MEFIFATMFVMLLMMGVVEVAFALYGRNVVASSAHEAARSAIELGSTPGDAEALARATVARSAGRLVEGFDVYVSTERTDDRVAVQVRVLGHLEPPGPLPVKIPVDLSATAVREVKP